MTNIQDVTNGSGSGRRRSPAVIVSVLLIASLVGHGLLYWLVQRHPVSQVTPYLLLAPVFEALLWPLVTWVLLAPQRRPPDPDQNRPL